MLALFPRAVAVPSTFADEWHQDLFLVGPGMYHAVLSQAEKGMALDGSWHRPIPSQGTDLLEAAEGKGKRRKTKQEQR